jgi:hypothetical protein
LDRIDLTAENTEGAEAEKREMNNSGYMNIKETGFFTALPGWEPVFWLKNPVSADRIVLFAQALVSRS